MLTARSTPGSTRSAPGGAPARGPRRGAPMAEDPYRVLGLHRSASAAEVQARYLELAKTRHPDSGDSRASQAAFASIKDARDRALNPRSSSSPPRPPRRGPGPEASPPPARSLHLLVHTRRRALPRRPHLHPLCGPGDGGRPGQPRLVRAQPRLLTCGRPQRHRGVQVARQLPLASC